MMLLKYDAPKIGIFQTGTYNVELAALLTSQPCLMQ